VSAYDDDLRRTRADAALRMYKGLLGTLSFNAAYAHLLRDAYGITAEQYEALDFETREFVLKQGRRDLVKAAGISRRNYEAMHRNSKERSDVLLAGAAKLGIKTDWPGWAEYPEWGMVTDYDRGTPLRPATREEWQRTADILAARHVPGWYTGTWEEDGRAVYVDGGPDAPSQPS
jgi:hypothetical protein